MEGRKRRPNATAMTQTVVNDVASFMRHEVPKRVQNEREFHCLAEIHIRGGVIHLVDVGVEVHDNILCQLKGDQDISTFIRNYERWLLRSIPPQLVFDGHGLIKTTVGMKAIVFASHNGMPPAVLTFKNMSRQQTKYCWDHLSKGV